MTEPTPRTKREFYEKAVAELNLDVRDPFTNLFANACALCDQRDELKRSLARAEALLREVLPRTKNGAVLDDLAERIERHLGERNDARED